ncbi:MAG: M23 family metallopeptidase [Solirubrobacterales bacterium]
MVDKTSRRSSWFLTAALVALISFVCGAVASHASAAGGGLSPSGKPRVSDATCMSRCVAMHKATPGATVKLTGSYLDETKQVVFKAATGVIAAEYSTRDSSLVEVKVPAGAASGRPYVVSEGGVSSNPSPHTLEVLPPTSIPKQVFPIRGPYEIWAGLGDGRGHEGADIGASCKTPLVAVSAGKVKVAKYHYRAGNYAVIDLNGSDLDLAYMHMIEPAGVKVGQRVSAGQVIGYVGETGNASGCHLHFEVWEGGYYEGGSPIDPLAFLKPLETKRVKRAR